MNPLFDTLNPPQKEAVLHKKGPALVLAGAGSGKTRVIAARIQHLIESGVSPEKILAITFTNKAAGEMRARIEAGNTRGEDVPCIATFHSLGVKLLREEARKAGRTRYFSIFDKEDSLSLIKKVLRREGYEGDIFDPRKILSVVSRGKGELLTPETLSEKENSFSKIMALIWELYDTELLNKNSFDFDDLVRVPVFLMQTNKEFSEKIASRWEYIHIDEYQDTNKAQYELSKQLSKKHRNIFAVGDNDQSIYSFRGADFRNIFLFTKDFPDANIVTLSQNYRSTKIILSAAQQIIEKNTDRIEKSLFTENAAGEKIALFAEADETTEAQRVAREIENLLKRGAAPEDIAVLYRANFQSRILEEVFLSRSIPHRVLGTRFYERKEVKDMLAFMRLLENEHDTESFSRVINIPPRGIGKVTLAKILLGKKEELSPGTKDKLFSFYKLLSDAREKKIQLRPAELLLFILKGSGLESHLKERGNDDLERLENIYELISIAKRYDALLPEDGFSQFLMDASLIRDDQDEPKKSSGVSLMTVHAAKGLEFQTVFITGLEEDLFPHAGLKEERDAEEERRLFYVALTRAQKKLFLSYAKKRTLYGKGRETIPSRFLFDVSEDLIETQEGEREAFIHI